jgi:methyl-accepting chemotaxis protein
LIFAWFGLLVVGSLNAVQTRQLLMQQRQLALAEQVDSAISIVRYYVQQAKSGSMSQQDAKDAAMKSLRAMRYGKHGYLLISDSHFIQILNPSRPELENKVNETVDPTGMRIDAEIVKHDFDGSHLTRYLAPKPGQSVPQPKITYGNYVREWDWHVFTGAYIDDIDHTFYLALAKSMSIVFAIGAAMTLGMVYLIRNVSASIGGDPHDVATICGRIAAGHLHERIELRAGDHNSLLYSMKLMQDQLIGTIAQIKRVADAIMSASREIADGHGDLSSRTEQQAASLSETAASIEQLSSTVRLNSDHAVQVSKLALDSSTTAETSNGIVAELKAMMDHIAKGSSRIFEITGVIESIAFQTNLLALNAAVEAARAGEHGRGFAVVATEVRALAQRSASAAKDVKELVDDSKAGISEGQRLAHHSGEIMHQVLDAVRQVTAIMGEISSASTQQAQGVEHLGLAMAQIDQITQQNAALVEEATASAIALASQADELNRAVDSFRLLA